MNPPRAIGARREAGSVDGCGREAVRQSQLTMVLWLKIAPFGP